MKAFHLFEYWFEEARVRTDWLLLDLYLPLKPIGKERPRGASHSTPIKTRSWTDYVGDCVSELMEGKPAIDFPVAAKVIFGLSGKKLPDTDNLEKALWDGLQRGDKRGLGRALRDDKYVSGHIEKIERLVEPGEEFFWVRFYAHNPDDLASYEEACGDDY